MTTAEVKTLPHSKADINIMQDAKLVDDTEISAAKSRCRKLGWNAHFGPAVRTKAGKPSAGTAVMARRGTGVHPVDSSIIDSKVRHRVGLHASMPW